MATHAIKGTGGDYATVTLWHAADYGGSMGTDEVGELYAEAYDEQWALTSTVVNSAQLIANSSNRHDGTAGSGPRFVFTGTAGTQMYQVDSTKVTLIEGFEIDANSKDPNNSVLRLTNLSGPTRKLIVHNANMTAVANNSMVSVESAVELNNCIIYDMELTPTTNADHCFGIRASVAGAKIYNCTVDNINQNRDNATNDAYGIQFVDNASTQVKNCLVTNVTAVNGGSVSVDYDPAMSTVVNAAVATNMSEDTTGSSGLTSITPSSQYTSLTGGSEDYHLKSGADAIDAGTDLTTTANEDIDYYDRDAGGVTWDIGADEFTDLVASVSFLPILGTG